MRQEANSPEEVAQIPVKGESEEEETPESLQGLLDALKSVQDDIGQICELTSEENSSVAAFFESLLKLMQPLARTIPVSPIAVSKEVGSVAQANLEPSGHLIILYADGRMELRSLSDEANRDLMISVAKDVLPKFKQLTGTYRQRIENRIKFLSAVTRELQKISKAFSTAISQQPK